MKILNVPFLSYSEPSRLGRPGFISSAFYRELIHKPVGAAEPESQAAAGGEPVLQSAINVGDLGLSSLKITLSPFIDKCRETPFRRRIS